MLKVDAKQPRGEQTCPLCRALLAGDEAQACVGCETGYHLACLGELGGCSTLGCSLRGKLPPSMRSWVCRACHAPIESDLDRRACRCRAFLHDGCVEAHGARCKHAQELRRGADTSLDRSVQPGWDIEEPTAGQGSRRGARREISWSEPASETGEQHSWGALAFAIMAAVVSGGMILYAILDLYVLRPPG